MWARRRCAGADEFHSGRVCESWLHYGCHFCALLPAQSTAGDSGKEESLKKFLRGYVSNSRVADDRTTRYAAAFVDLKEDGTEEAIVYLMGPLWCGSGGCSCLVLLPAGESYKVVTKTTITQ